MLEMRPGCECCDKNLAADSGGAMICSFECTFCEDCARHVLHGVCPNCGGGLVPRPTRPVARLVGAPGRTDRVFNPDCQATAQAI